MNKDRQMLQELVHRAELFRWCSTDDNDYPTIRDSFDTFMEHCKAYLKEQEEKENQK